MVFLKGFSRICWYQLHTPNWVLPFAHFQCFWHLKEIVRQEAMLVFQWNSKLFNIFYQYWRDLYIERSNQLMSGMVDNFFMFWGCNLPDISSGFVNPNSSNTWVMIEERMSWLLAQRYRAEIEFVNCTTPVNLRPE